MIECDAISRGTTPRGSLETVRIDLTLPPTYKPGTPPVGELSREAHLSTIEARPQKAPWLPRAYGDEGRPQGAGAAESQGAQAPFSLGGGTAPDAKVTAIGRLKTRAEYLQVRNGVRFATPSLVLQARERPTPDEVAEDIARFGFTATKSLGGAVERNRARRRLKEAVRLVASSKAKSGYDYVLIAREGTLQRHFTELTKDLERALSKVHQAPRA